MVSSEQINALVLTYPAFRVYNADGRWVARVVSLLHGNTVAVRLGTDEHDWLVPRLEECSIHSVERDEDSHPFIAVNNHRYYIGAYSPVNIYDEEGTLGGVCSADRNSKGHVRVRLNRVEERWLKTHEHEIVSGIFYPTEKDEAGKIL